MSSKAITNRLRLASELRDLSLALMKAKRLHGEKPRAENVHYASLDIDNVVSTEQTLESDGNN